MHSIKKAQTGLQPITTFVIADKGRGKGSTLIEVIVAAVILIIALIGYSSSFVSGRKQISNQRQYQMAVHLTSQRIEEIRANGYPAATIGEQRQELALDELTCIRTTTVELSAEPTALIPQPLKKISVTTSWTGIAQDPHQIKLVTYIGP